MSREIDTRDDNPPAELTARERFHWIHGGWCTPPGRVECAKRTAAAEEKMERAGWTWTTEDDPNGADTRGDTDYDGPWSGVVLVDADGKRRYEFALWGIDTENAEGAYGRSVAADLAMDADAAGAFDARKQEPEQEPAPPPVLPAGPFEPPNLDDYTTDAAELRVLGDVLGILSRYAHAKASSMSARQAGEQSAAWTYDAQCGRLYEQLPEWARW